MKILCICLGNICRSPMAEGVLRDRAARHGLALEIDSAGLGAWHLGSPPHPEGLATAAARGYDTSAQRARQVEAQDFHDFDLMLAMDHANLGALARMRPPTARAEIRLFDEEHGEVPDPYGNGRESYEAVLDQIEAAADRLIAEIARR